jgi:hypothetical protein
MSKDTRYSRPEYKKLQTLFEVFFVYYSFMHLQIISENKQHSTDLFHAVET